MSNPNEAEKFKYDVFLSHSSKDKPVVRELAERLKADGVRVWFDEWEIQIGDSIPSKIEQGLEESRILILAMSANAFGSDWVSLERGTAIFRDPQNKQRRFIPVRLDNSEIKETLKQFLYVDWRRRDDEQYKSLLATCRSSFFNNQLDKNGINVPIIKGEVIKVVTATNNFVPQGFVNVYGVDISSDGKLIIFGDASGDLWVNDAISGQCLKHIKGKGGTIFKVVFTQENRKAISVTTNSLKCWDLESGVLTSEIEFDGVGTSISVITKDNKRLIFANYNDDLIRVLDIENDKYLYRFQVTHFEKPHHNSLLFNSTINCLSSVTGELIAVGHRDNNIRLWDLGNRTVSFSFEGHSNTINTVAMSQDETIIVSGSADKTLRIWSIKTGKCLSILEGHTGEITSIVITPDKNLIISGSVDKTLRLWEMFSGKCLAILESTSKVYAIATTPDVRFVTSVGEATVQLWNLSAFLHKPKTTDASPSIYTNAKVLLVGDSGVGKSGLANRLIENKFMETVSTDGVWATQLKLPGDVNTEDTEREIWLWDFAGQSDYRLIHQLFMDETSLAVLVFNPQSDNPFEGLGQWDRDLQRAARRPFNKLLVAGRCDRGELTVSQKSIDEFISQRGFVGYLRTSALTGENCEELRRAIIENINWNGIPHRTSPRIFKLLKDEIVRLKDEGKVLLRVAELKQQLEMRLPDERFEIEELRAVVGLLAGSGVVWELEFGDFVLLQPERINSYAGALVRSVRAHVEEIGCISEEKVLAGELDYQDMERLPRFEEDIVLRAMLQTFVSRGLCLQEKTDAGTLLIFPSYFRRERPEKEKYPAVLVTYQFSGMLDEIYATLVVRLHHTKAFDKHQLWRYAADFKTQSGKIVGMKMIKKAEGAAKITVYFDREISDETKVVFIRYVHDHLKAKDENVTRKRHYVCPHCETPFENEKAIEIRLKKGEKTILCPVCEERFDLLDLIEEKFASDEFGQQVREMEEQAQIGIDNQSKELILVGHAFAIAGEAGQIFRPTANSDWGIDGEIEFKNYKGKASGKKVYLQLKSGNSYLRKRKRDNKDIFYIDKEHAEYWLAHNYPVMLVIRTSDGEIRWMNATDYLRKHGTDVKQIVFDGETFDLQNVIKLRDEFIPTPKTVRR